MPRVQLQARQVDGRLGTTPPQNPEHATLLASLAELRSEMNELRSENKRLHSDTRSENKQLHSRTHGAVMSVGQRVALSAARTEALFADSARAPAVHPTPPAPGTSCSRPQENTTRELFLKNANHTTAVGKKVVGAVFEATSETDAQLHQVPARPSLWPHAPGSLHVPCAPRLRATTHLNR